MLPTSTKNGSYNKTWYMKLNIELIKIYKFCLKRFYVVSIYQNIRQII